MYPPYTYHVCVCTCSRVLEQTVKELSKASTEVEEKVRRGGVDHDTAAKKKAEDAQRKKVLAQIKGDKAERQVRVTVRHSPCGHSACATVHA